jgi:muconolactone delta-isomerase
MQFLSVTARKIAEYGAEAFTPELVSAESNRIRELYIEGLLRQIWRRGDTPGACALWEASSEADVRSRLQSLPLFKRGMLDIVSILPLHPYPGFGPPQP